MNNKDISRLMSEMEKKSQGVKSDKSKEQVEKMLKNLNDEQAEKLKQVLADPKKTQEVLNSPAAKALMKKLMNNG
ncbi:MAG: hypothetical protein ACI4HO_09820 [Ruminococcus sp.]